MKVNGDLQVHMFDYVVVGIGHNHDPWFLSEEEMANQKDFQGDIVHSS